jgi:hypothetical protein
LLAQILTKEGLELVEQVALKDPRKGDSIIKVVDNPETGLAAFKVQLKEEHV